MNKVLKTNPIPAYLQLFSIFTGGIIIFLVSSVVLRKINKAVIFELNDMIAIVQTIVAIGTIIAAMLAWARKKMSKYELTDDSIVISKSGITTRKKIYSFTNINSLGLKQGLMGSRYNFGDVYINMDRLENNVEVVLRHVEGPEAIVNDINQHRKSTRS